MPFVHCQRWVKSVIKFVCNSSQKFAKDMIKDACDAGQRFCQKCSVHSAWFLVAPHLRISLGFLLRVSHLCFVLQIVFHTILVFHLFWRFVLSVAALYTFIYERSIPYLSHLCFILQFQYMIRDILHL